MTRARPNYPFNAVVGQDKAKRALLLHAVHPGLGGALLIGPNGTAKSTLARALAELVPERRMFVVPPHVSEDRLVGSIDMANTLKRGERSWAPGLLAEAGGQMVVADDVHLMPERLLRAVLEPVVFGEAAVERDGLRAKPKTRFLLFGTTNPAEAQLGDALLDGWGLCIGIEPVIDAESRMEIIRRRLAYEKDPAEFTRRFEAAQAELRARIAAAAALLPGVVIGGPALRLAAEIAEAAGSAGHRCELRLAETARAIAAWDGRSAVREEDVREAAGYVLPYRTAPVRDVPEKGRRGEQEPGGRGRDAAPGGEAVPERGDSREAPAEQASAGSAGGNAGTRANEGAGDAAPKAGGPQQPAAAQDLARTPAEQPHAGPHGGKADAARGPVPAGESEAAGAPRSSASASAAREIVEAAGREYAVQPLSFAPPRRHLAGGSGTRNKTPAAARAGKYVRAVPARGAVRDLALDATLRAAAPYQGLRLQARSAQTPSGAEDVAVIVEPGDFREKVREGRTGTALLFVVDASGSMTAAKRMRAVKGAVLSLLRDAYLRRDSVGLVAFRGDRAEKVLEITRSVELADRRLRSLAAGGKTPLAAGLRAGFEELRTVMRKQTGQVPALILLTDGKANAASKPDLDPWQECLKTARYIADHGIPALVIDTEQGFVRLGLARQVADALQARYCRLEQLESGAIAEAVRRLL